MEYVLWFLGAIAIVVPACAGLALTEWLENRNSR